MPRGTGCFEVWAPYLSLCGPSSTNDMVGHGADDGTRIRTLTEKQIIVPPPLSPPPFAGRELLTVNVDLNHLRIEITSFLIAIDRLSQG